MQRSKKNFYFRKCGWQEKIIFLIGFPEIFLFRSSTIILILKGIDVLMSKSPCILLNKNINLNKNETESKMENPTHSFREASLVMSWNALFKIYILLDIKTHHSIQFCCLFLKSSKAFSQCTLKILLFFENAGASCYSLYNRKSYISDPDRYIYFVFPNVYR